MKAAIIITAFKEPNIEKAVESIVSQRISMPYNLIVSTPDKETKERLKKYKRVKVVHDPGRGKSFAINLLLPTIKGDIIILTDGDVIIGDGAINSIIEKFKEKNVGVVTGRPISQNKKDNLFGFWSHFLLDVGAHEISRKKRSQEGKNVECSGYLFAFKNKVIKKIPLDVAEDAIIPYYFSKKGYKIVYADKARVMVRYPISWKDWLKQRRRSAAAHENLKKYAPDIAKVKSFRNEVFYAMREMRAILAYPKTFKEYFWLKLLFLARLYVWLRVKKDVLFKKKVYRDGWERIESTK